MYSLAAPTEVHPARPRAFVRFGRGDGNRVFREAVRHSRRVRFLRVAIPGAVVVLVVGAAAFVVLDKPLRVLSKMPVDLGSLVVSGSKIMMQHPRLAGFTRDNRRYDLTAQAAGQDLTKPDLVELHGIRATMEMQDQTVFETTAHGGVYNTKAEVLTLSQNVVVTSSTGYQALLSEAVVDIRSGKILSEKPVEMKTSTWTVSANWMEVADAGKLLRFDRGVTVTLLPDDSLPRTADASQGRRP
jgi:lipopolysaccharide export system protein LptC